MASVRERPKADSQVQIRMPAQTKLLIEAAANSLGKSLSAFVIESASQHAVDVLLDRRVFDLSPDAAEAFARVLDNPPAPTAKLRELLASKSPWE
jgi:uncharacterized protein (DUF1778 family)